MMHGDARGMHGRVEFEARESEGAVEMTTSDARSLRGDLDDADRRPDETPQGPSYPPKGAFIVGR